MIIHLSCLRCFSFLNPQSAICNLHSLLFPPTSYPVSPVSPDLASRFPQYSMPYAFPSPKSEIRNPKSEFVLEIQSLFYSAGDTFHIRHVHHFPAKIGGDHVIMGYPLNRCLQR